MKADLEKKQKIVEYYKKVFPKRIIDGINFDVDANGDFLPDYYWVLENMILVHEIFRKICEPQKNFKFGWYFKFYFDFLKEIIEKRNNHLVINIAPGHGKCHSKGTLIRMFDGSLKKVECIKTGDLLMGPDNKKRSVLSTTSGKSIMFRIKLQDGTFFECNGEHILHLQNIKTFEKLNISVFDFLNKTKSFQKKYKIVKTGIEYDFKKIDIEPYHLGYWLAQKKDNSLYIPKNYLLNDKKIRLKLLAGFIDKNGYFKTSHDVEMVCENKRISNDLVELCRSLGFFTTIKKEKKYFLIKIFGNVNIIPTIIKNKHKDKKLKKNPLLQSFKIKNIGYGEYYGFEVDKDHLYILDNFTVCHNSTVLMTFICLYLGFFPHTRFLILSVTEKVRDDYMRDMKSILNSSFYKQLFPNVEIDNDLSNNKEEFYIKKFNYKGIEEGGGHIFVCPINGNKTGLNSDFTIVDDPVDYDRYKKEKENYIDDVNSIVGGLITRDRGIIGDEAGFILCMQRICANDPTNFILSRQNKKWKHIEIPAKVEDGKDVFFDEKNNKTLFGKFFESPYRKIFIKNGNFVFPEKFNEEKFQFQREMINNDIHFQWQYFQYCKGEDGKIFHLSCINRYKKEEIKDIVFDKVIISIDSSAGGENDYQSMQLWGFTTFENNITRRKEINSYLLDVYLSQEKTPKFTNTIIDWYVEYRPNFVLVEEKSSGIDIINSLEIMVYGGLLDKKDPRKNKIIIGINPKLSKEDRAISASIEVNSSRVFFPENFDKTTKLDRKQVFVIKELERELDVFPSNNKSVHDDAVDSLTQALNWARLYFNRNKQRVVGISYI